jgi:hypothetical protein
MNIEPGIKVDQDLHVNSATLELLRRRIEADVKRGFWTSIGAPIGGAGIIAILYVLFSWIPAQIDTLIQGMPHIQRTVQDSVLDYLQDEKKGKAFIREQVNLNTEKYVSSAVSDHLASAEMATVLKSEVEERTKAYYESDQGEQLVQQLIKSYMASENIRLQIREAAKKALAPLLASLTHDIENSFSSVVYDIPQLAGTEQIDKRSIGVLMEFLGSAKAREIKNAGSPIVLTFTLGYGKYDVNVIEMYINQLQQAYGEQFRHIAVVDQNRKFIALLPVDPFRGAVHQERVLMDVLNGDDSRRAKVFFRERFGPAIERHIQTSDLVQNVLRNRALWQTGSGPGFVAVVDAEGVLVGITNQNKIIEGCLDQLNT